MKRELRLGNGQRARDILHGIEYHTHADLQAFLEGLGYKLVIEKIVEMRSDKQNRALHWLLGEWLNMDPSILLGQPQTKRLTQLKRQVQIESFGAAKMTDEHGNVHYVPLQTLTGRWDWDIVGYRNKQLTRDQFKGLIDMVYALAKSWSNVDLPELQPEMASEL